MAAITAGEIREGVRLTFNHVAEAPTDAFRFLVGADLARQVGYPEDVLTSLPSIASETFTGLAYLHPHLSLRPGEHVLDLGSGGGMDAVLVARSVAPGGMVKGLDLAEAMVDRARQLAADVGVGNAEFVQGDAETMPFGAETFDAAIVNGFFNLCPDKQRVAEELFRVLRRGGRAAVAEITFTDPLPPTEVRTVSDWFRWIAGALPEAALLALFREAGFAGPAILARATNARTKTPGTFIATLLLRKPE